jgi:hypothetical protein
MKRVPPSVRLKNEIEGVLQGTCLVPELSRAEIYGGFTCRNGGIPDRCGEARTALSYQVPDIAGPHHGNHAMIQTMFIRCRGFVRW